MCSLVSLHCDADMPLPLVLIGTCACLTAVVPRYARVVSTLMRTYDRFSVIRVRTQELSRLWEMSLNFLLGVLLPSRVRNDFIPPLHVCGFRVLWGHSCRQVGATTLQCTATLLQHHLWYTSTYVGHPLTTLENKRMARHEIACLSSVSRVRNFVLSNRSSTMTRVGDNESSH
jgi:hypothetical protein